MSGKGTGKPDDEDDDDSDLADLLSSSLSPPATSSSEETKPLNLDHLTRGPLEIGGGDGADGGGGDGGGRRPRGSPRVVSPSSWNRRPARPSLWDVLTAHCSLVARHRPVLTMTLGIATLVLVVLGLASLLSPVEEIGHIENHYFDVRSVYDLTMGKIDHWCLEGDDDSCLCEDPLTPTSRMDDPSWSKAFRSNVKSIDEYRTLMYGKDGTPYAKQLDVAFLGESLVEEMDGRWMGRPVAEEHLERIKKVFEKHFRKESKVAHLEGVALGVAGDTSPNVLWRLQHGEMPSDFNPTVWWISLGMNDLARAQCSEEVVVLGVLRVVEEIMEKKPDAKIVINGLLPMADVRGGPSPRRDDFMDAFRGERGAWRDRVRTGNRDRPNKYRGPPIMTKEGEGEGGGGGNRRRIRQRRDMASSSSSASDRSVVQRLDWMRKKKKRTDDSKSSDKKQRKKRIDKQQKFNTHVDETRRWARKKPSANVDPRLRDVKRFKKRGFFLKTRRVPLWPAIHAINDELKAFCRVHDRVTFFDATPIFAAEETTESGKAVTLMTDMISPRGHPTTEGFKVWEDAVAEKLNYMLRTKANAKRKKMDEEADDVPSGRNDAGEADEKGEAEAEAKGGESSGGGEEGSEEDEDDEEEDEKDHKEEGKDADEEERRARVN